jgi:serine/threonine-protein kinase
MSGQDFQIVGRYLLGSPIASGGMATVYLGRPLSLPRVVAIKRLSPELARDETFVRMFLDEVQLLCRIRHKNVVAPIEHFQNDGEFFIVMEYVEGLSLAQLMRAKAPLDVHLASKIMCGVLTGLHAAHEAFDSSGQPLNMVHRDVSPHNILVGTDGESRIADFGIAKAAWRAYVTQHGERKGKPAYMSPEQWSLADVDRRTDIYAAGIVLWELLTGTRLFPDPSMRYGADDVHAEIPAPSTVVKGLSCALDEVTLRALATDPNDRFQDAERMADALRAATTPARDLELGAWAAACGKKELARRAELMTELEGMRPSELTPVTRGYAVPQPAVSPSIFPQPSQEPAPAAATRIAAPARGGLRQTVAMTLTVAVALVGASYVAQSRNPQLTSDAHRAPAGSDRVHLADHVDRAGTGRETVSPDPGSASQPMPAPSIAVVAPPASSMATASSASSAVRTVRAPLRSDTPATGPASVYDPLRDARRR